MPYPIRDLDELPPGTRINGVIFHCEYCLDTCIGSRVTKYCSASCRLRDYRDRKAAAEAEAKAAEQQRFSLGLLKRFAPAASSQKDAAEYISANVSGEDILATEGIGQFELDWLARLVYQHGFHIRRHLGSVTGDDDLVVVKF